MPESEAVAALFMISLLVKMETEMETGHYVLTADSRWFSVYGALIAGVALFLGELAFNHTSRLIGSIIITGNVTRFEVKLLGLV